MSAPKFGDEMALGLLTEIRDGIRELVALSKARLARTAPAQGRAENSERVASDADLDSAKGDEIVRMDPRDWTGPSCKRKRMSECPSEFLEMYAGALDYFAEKNDEQGKMDNQGKQKASYWDRKAAARARGWAVRNRNKPATEPEDDGFGGKGSF